MKLWKISQTEVDGYDVYDSAIVAAETESDAKKINPGGHWEAYAGNFWCSSPDVVTAQLIGEAEPDIPAGVVLARFNAG